MDKAIIPELNPKIYSILSGYEKIPNQPGNEVTIN